MSGEKLEYLVGTMIELPRACLRAGEIAETAEFFSFGTNDLTQTTFGLSRDDSGVVPGEVPAARHPRARSVRLARYRGRRRADRDRLRARPQGAAQAQGRHLRRAWRRSGLGVLLPQGRPRLRLVLALPRADRAAGGGAGGAGRRAQDGMSLDALRRAGWGRQARARSGARRPGARSRQRQGATPARRGLARARARMSSASPVRRASASPRYARRWSRPGARRARPSA